MKLSYPDILKVLIPYHCESYHAQPFWKLSCPTILKVIMPNHSENCHAQPLLCKLSCPAISMSQHAQPPHRKVIVSWTLETVGTAILQLSCKLLMNVRKVTLTLLLACDLHQLFLDTCSSLESIGRRTNQIW